MPPAAKLPHVTPVVVSGRLKLKADYDVIIYKCIILRVMHQTVIGVANKNNLFTSSESEYVTNILFAF